MTRSELISMLALLVSFASLVVSVFFNLRDRQKLVASSKFIAFHPEYGPAHVDVAIVNAGRRPIILRMWGGSDNAGEWVGEYLGKEHAGLRLSEHERHDITVSKDDLYSSTPHSEIIYKVLWVEDSLGRRHVVKDSRRNVQLLWNT